MEAIIDPLTGGIKWIEKSKDQTYFKQIFKKENEAAEKEQPKQIDLNSQFNPIPSSLSLQERYNKIMGFGEEVTDPADLMEVLKNKQHPICYDGFEPSGRMHIAQGIMRVINVNKLIDAGCIFVFWVADWFAALNNKMGGDLHKIRTVGRYFIETWKAAGMKMHNVKFLWASDEINKNPNQYWLTVMDVARKNNLARIKRCSQIMGRNEEDDLSVAQMFYPCMQTTDVFYLNCDITSLGKDQRKVNMLAREYADDAKLDGKPVIVSHHMLAGLTGQKMAKSDPMSAIFMEDSEEDVNKKLKAAYCKPCEIENNPPLDYCRHIIFESFPTFVISRKEEHGGDLTYFKFDKLREDFKNDKVHPDDLKKSVAKYINDLIRPVRDHFTNNPEAKELLQQIKIWQAEQEQDKKKPQKKAVDIEGLKSSLTYDIIRPVTTHFQDKLDIDQFTGKFKEWKDSMEKSKKAGNLNSAINNIIDEIVQPLRSQLTSDLGSKQFQDKITQNVQTLDQAKKSGSKQEEEKKEEEKKESGGSGEVAAEDIEAFTKVDIRVGNIVSCESDETSDKLYFEKVDMGNGEIRTIGSGLKLHVDLKDMSGLVLVMANLKEKKLNNKPSNGMVLAASNVDKSKIELMRPAPGSKIGERVVLEGYENKFSQDKQPEQKGVGKNKKLPFQKVAEKMLTDDGKFATLGGIKWKTEKGYITSQNLTKASIS